MDDLRRKVDVLAEQVGSMQRGEEWIQAKLYDLSVTLAALAPPQEGSTTPDPAYAQVVRKIRETVRRTLPRDATVVVVTKGDEGLLDLYGRRGWHFPQAADGGYLWYYPPDGPSVIAQIETLRVRGAQYLLFPEPAMWWLERYPDFGTHLHNHYPVIVENGAQTGCVIFSLEGEYARTETESWSARIPGLITEFAHSTGADPAILDWNTGLDLVESFPGLAVFSPPDESTKLPYFDNSVDIVVLSDGDPDALCDARRVASFAVVTVTARDRQPDAPLTESDHHLEASVERVHDPERGGGMPSTSIIIPTHDGIEHLRLCLTSLRDALPEPFVGEVIVVDDGSGEEMQAMLREWKEALPYLRVIRNSQNRGFVASCNRGARAAKSDILVFLNDDTIPQTGWLRGLLRTFRDRPDAGAVGGKLIYPDGRLQEAGNLVFSDGSAANFGRDDRLADSPLYTYVRAVDYCSGALLATPRELFLEIGGFDKRFAPGYYEDTDYCFEVRKRGLRVYYQPESLVVHTEGGTGGTDLTSGTKRFQVVNHGKFARKWKDALRSQPKRPAQLDASTLHALALEAAAR